MGGGKEGWVEKEGIGERERGGREIDRRERGERERGYTCIYIYIYIYIYI